MFVFECSRGATGNPLKDGKVAESAALRAVLEAGAHETPAKCQKRLCKAKYHCQRKQIENYRLRQKALLRAQGLPTLSVDEMLGQLAATDFAELATEMAGLQVSWRARTDLLARAL